MNKVEPIKDIDDVKRILDVLKKKNMRNYLLALYGFYSGLRISDLLPLRVKDVKNRTHIRIIEEKREHKRDVVIPKKLQKITAVYIANKEEEEFLFKSNRGYNKPISSTQAYRILNDAAKAANVNVNIGTHSLRKTFAYHLYKNTKDIVYVQEILGHSNINITKRYLGIDIDEVEDAINKLGFI
ncbi:MAG: tyrosine-type recombinase/integrase [Intestinibacter sp.]|uniref:tyrosine-type recombinase/integrase n=1 Tax=Intestinibacter sp. TaxID=1965304 RepID=UPI003F15AB8D